MQIAILQRPALLAVLPRVRRSDIILLRALAQDAVRRMKIIILILG